MSRRTLGTLTVGQAPRPDVTPIIDAHVPAQVRQIHRGVLDGLSRAEIEARFGVERGEPVLISRLLDGSSVQLSGRKVHDGVRAKLAGLEDEGCDVILLLCTGRFHGLECRSSFLLEPDRIIPPAAAGLAGRRRLGIIVPLASQMRSESEKWNDLSQPPIFDVTNPYDDPPETLAQAGIRLKESNAEGMLLDCIGFTEQHRRTVAEATGLPVILSNALMAKMAGELLA
jgi:protein AroM